MKPSRWMDVNTHTHTTKHSILDIAAALDPPLLTTYLRCGQIDFGANLLSFSPA